MPAMQENGPEKELVRASKKLRSGDSLALMLRMLLVPDHHCQGNDLPNAMAVDIKASRHP